jgi:hypothetical protein
MLGKVNHDSNKWFCATKIIIKEKTKWNQMIILSVAKLLGKY